SVGSASARLLPTPGIFAKAALAYFLLCPLLLRLRRCGVVDENGSLGFLVADFDGRVRAGRNVHVDIAVVASERVERFEVTGLSVHRRDAAPAGRLRSHEE